MWDNHTPQLEQPQFSQSPVCVQQEQGPILIRFSLSGSDKLCMRRSQEVGGLDCSRCYVKNSRLDRMMQNWMGSGDWAAFYGKIYGFS